MATNRGDEVLGVLRTRLLTVPGLPVTRLWQNQRGEPSPTVAHVEDGLVLMDTEPRETGPGAWGRSQVLYRVGVRVPTGTDAHALLALAVAIGDAFRTEAPVTVSGSAVFVTDVRTGPVLTEPQWLYAPVNIALTFDHA